MVDWLPINWRLLSHPSNWIVVFLMILFAVIAYHLLEDMFVTDNNSQS